MGKGGGRVDFDGMNDLSYLPQLKIWWKYRERGTVAERRAQDHNQSEFAQYTRIHPYLPSLSSSKMSSYINETTPGERDTEKGEVKSMWYIYTPHPTTTIIPRWGRNSKV